MVEGLEDFKSWGQRWPRQKSIFWTWQITAKNDFASAMAAYTRPVEIKLGYVLVWKTEGYSCPHLTWRAINSWWWLEKEEAVFFTGVVLVDCPSSNGWSYTHECIYSTNWTQLDYKESEAETETERTWSLGNTSKIGETGAKKINVTEIHYMHIILFKNWC